MQAGWRAIVVGAALLQWGCDALLPYSAEDEKNDRDAGDSEPVDAPSLPEKLTPPDLLPLPERQPRPDANTTPDLSPQATTCADQSNQVLFELSAPPVAGATLAIRVTAPETALPVATACYLWTWVMVGVAPAAAQQPCCPESTPPVADCIKYWGKAVLESELMQAPCSWRFDGVTLPGDGAPFSFYFVKDATLDNYCGGFNDIATCAP